MPRLAIVVPTVRSLTEMPIINPSVNREFINGLPHSVSCSQKCRSMCSGCGLSVMLENSMLSICVTVRVRRCSKVWPSGKSSKQSPPRGWRAAESVACSMGFLLGMVLRAISPAGPQNSKLRAARPSALAAAWTPASGRSILVRIELLLTGHDHGKGAQRVEHAHGAFVLGEHVGQATVGLRRLVEPAADEQYALLPQPRQHLVVADAARHADLLAGRRIALKAAARLGARHHPARAVDRAVERRARFFAVDALQDHRVVAHRAADEAALPGERRGGALAHDPQFSAEVLLAPGVIVMVVNCIGTVRAENRAHLVDHPFAPGVGIGSRELHRGEIALP